MEINLTKDQARNLIRQLDETRSQLSQDVEALNTIIRLLESGTSHPDDDSDALSLKKKLITWEHRYFSDQEVKQHKKRHERLHLYKDESTGAESIYWS